MERFVYYNANPFHNKVGDCTVRAISKALNQNWYETFVDLCLQGIALCDMPSANNVWGAYLKSKGFERNILPDTCPNCYTVEDFCEEHPIGTYILALGTHVICCQNGFYYDTWDSGNETPIYYWRRKEL